ncbi:MAG: adenylosuccinate synthetase, partial [Candidatus Saccharimonas sp.]|nr:adenylosuccinate synthetase [Candidatus Saccharimonas sp.]
MSSERQSHATITTDLSYGDAGKGTTTEWLAHESYSAVVIRFNGGGQAEHN